MRNRERGFTLLEVLAAVSLLIVLFIPLVRTAIDGLRSEGESRRRLEASLLADEALAAIESGIAIGSVPDIGQSAEEVREFRIVTSVTSFEPPFARVEDDDPKRPSSPRPEPAHSLFPAPDSRQESPLRRIEVRVSWPAPGEDGSDLEGEGHARAPQVARTTFALDIAGVADELAVLELATQGEPGLKGLLQ